MMFLMNIKMSQPLGLQNNLDKSRSEATKEKGYLIRKW